MKSLEFEQKLDPTNDAQAWKSIKDVIHGGLGGTRSKDFRASVKKMLKYFERIGVNMALKIHLLHHHLDVLEKQRSTESDEHGERYHQTALPFEKR